MNNESFKSPKITTTVSHTSANNNCSNVNTSSSTTAATSFSSISSSLSLSSSATQSYSPSTQLDVTVNAIAAVVNATNNFGVITPPNAAAVVAVAVSSLAAAIIPDTPIVSIAGLTLSEITTTTTSTKTTPTPVPTTKETGSINNNTNTVKLNSNKKSNYKDLHNKISPSSSSSTIRPTSPSFSTTKQSIRDLGSMSFANSSITGALTNASTTAANAAAAENDNNASSFKQIKDKTPINLSCGTAVTKCDSLSAESKSNVPVNKTDDINITPNKSKSKEVIPESWEESRLKDWDDSKLKELLDEAYSYKNPRDKENKSKTFLQLLEKAENEDQSYPFCVTSRGSRNLSNPITSNSYHHYQQNSHYHSHSHNHNRSHHHKQGGSLQDLFEIGLHESQLDCDPTFGIGISGNQRTRRQNHNSRQKKYSSSVSSRQREGGSLPSNVNVVNDLSLMQQQEVPAGAPGKITTINTSKFSKKEQRRNASKVAATSVGACSEAKDNNTINSVGEAVVNNKNTLCTTNPTYAASIGDVIIDIGEPMMDIQQQQKILQCKGQDAATQGHPFYERLANNDKRIPRGHIIGNTKQSYLNPIASNYVDEKVCFDALERNGNTIEAKYLPLDENYKSCKSVLGCDVDNSPEILGNFKSNTIYTKISAPASGSAILTGTTNNIATLTQRQLDENGNALSEIYQNPSSAVPGSGATIHINAVSPTAANASAALLNSCGNVSTSATVTISPHSASTTVSTSATVTTTFTSGPSQAKAKAKKKSQQERNTKTVDVESVAGYRGKDPVEELVKYIESSGEDKQTCAGSGSKSGDKKKERKRDKEKHQKLKKSNSLEELRSGAKMEVHELKRTAATTESNAVLVRQKSGGGSKQNKNNSSSTADIDKNLDGGKNTTQTTHSRKSDRRSWGNEDLKYLEDQQNANLINEDKSTITAANLAKERKHKIAAGNGGVIITMSSREEKEMKDKTTERNERNLANNEMSNATPTTIQNEKADKLDKSEKIDKMEKIEKLEKLEKPEKYENKLDKFEKRKKQDIPENAVTVVDILAIESVLPETAEFHVVTKKKKPKKQKIINNLEETTVTFNRTHNFTMQKTSTFNQQQQQMTVRYKYYHHDNSSNNTGISNTNTNSQNHQQQSNNFNSSNFVGASNSHQHHNQHQNQLQHQQQHHQQHNTSENYSNTNDKSRRKSTSSVPPSEKSDSSDLDSVHSLPIESSKANPNNTMSNAAKIGNRQQRTTRGGVNANNINLGNNICNNNNNNSLITSKNHNLPVAPISYADIARTNKEIADAVAASASGILINNNEISTECRNADAITPTTDYIINTEEKSVSTKNPATTTSPIATAVTLPAKIQKIKKSQQIKQDFPELSVNLASSNDDKILSANANQKTLITYSQSLTAVTNLIQNTTSAQTQANISGGCNVVNVVSSINDTTTTSTSEVNTKALALDNHKNIILHQHANIPPLQHPQQQILQKSKSVENDSITTSTIATLSSAATYMASMNSNNLDQQYPALEKTVKRHSSANATMIGMTTNTSNQTPFNFAAAAKQQINITNVAADQHMNSALTTSNTTINNNNNNNTIQTTLLSSSNINATKKSKEKTPPPLTSPSNLILTGQHQITPDSCAFKVITTNNNNNASTITASSIAANPKKSKKERHQELQQQHVQLQQSSVDGFMSKQNNNQNTSSTVSSKRQFKTQVKSSNSLLLGSGSSSSTTSTSMTNRPAVIILNDDRNSGSCTADNQFTFGDFNEEELKMFDDDNNNSSVVENTNDNNVDINMNHSNEELLDGEGEDLEDEDEEEEYEDKHIRTFSSKSAMKSPSIAYFNDSGTTIETSSPNTSFVANSHGNNGCSGGAGLHMPVLNNNNQSNDSGIHTEKIKSSNSSSSSSNSSTFGFSAKQKQKQQITPTKLESNKLNTFVPTTKCASVHTSMDNLKQPLPPPQQLETCNSIETAIIAAARAAAKYQQPAHSHQKQQNQYKNSNASSNSSSFSSTTSAYHHQHSHQQQQQQQHHQHHHNHQQQQQHNHQQPQQQLHHNSKINNSNKNYQNQHGRRNIMSYHQSPPHNQYNNEDYENDDNDDDNNSPRSRSPSHPRRISIAGGTVANKEFDIHFIPPTTMPTAFSTQQHNDTIIDFIGSAWEEVANSKVTKVYDGQ